MFFLILVVILLIGGLVTFIAMQNLTPPVHFNLFSLPIPDLPLGVWLIAAFLCGAIVLYLVAMLSGLEDQHKMKVLRKRVLALEEQVAAMTQTSSSSAGQTSEGGSSSAGQTPEGRLSVADTPPLMPMPGVMNTPQPDGRIPSAPLSPLQNFRQ